MLEIKLQIVFSSCSGSVVNGPLVISEALFGDPQSQDYFLIMILRHYLFFFIFSMWKNND